MLAAAIEDPDPLVALAAVSLLRGGRSGGAILLLVLVVSLVLLRDNDELVGVKLTSGADDLLTDLLGQGKLLRGNKLDTDVVELEQLDERVNGASVTQVTSEGDGQAGHSSELLTDGEQIQERLGRVLDAAVATVDDRDLRELGGGLSAAGLGVAIAPALWGGSVAAPPSATSSRSTRVCPVCSAGSPSSSCRLSSWDISACLAARRRA